MISFIIIYERQYAFPIVPVCKVKHSKEFAPNWHYHQSKKKNCSKFGNYFFYTAQLKLHSCSYQQRQIMMSLLRVIFLISNHLQSILLNNNEIKCSHFKYSPKIYNQVSKICDISY